MVQNLRSAAIHGIDGRPVDIEVDILTGVSTYVVSGLPGKRVRESRERVRSAIQNSGFHYPLDKRIVVNLAPATWEKDGSVFDLAIALGLLGATSQVRMQRSEKWGILGELSLDGRLRPVAGTLGMVMAIRSRGLRRVLLPAASLPEGEAVPGVECVGVESLRHAVDVLRGVAPGSPGEGAPPPPPEEPLPDLSEVIGHGRLKRALALAVAGGHNVLFVGSPGSGKSLLARRIGGLMPPPDPEEILEITQIHSAAGTKREPGLMWRRPFRAPHHTVSWAGLVGGGQIPRPGEITLAHRGVLFLDELAEFPRRSLEALREPLEEGCITIARSHGALTFPASFLLVAAMNPCPCGYFLHPRRACRCTADQIRRAVERISGPLLDRFDLRIEVHSPPGVEMLTAAPADGMESARLREEVLHAQRFRDDQGRHGLNRGLPWADRRAWAPLTPRANALLTRTSTELDLSTRALTRILRLARTIADMEASPDVHRRHIQEAIDFHSPRGAVRSLEMLGW